ncbi:hypothetical protein SmJEL517_g00562 [Synchytrium microbalum]|uniref:CBS domain-containing protein n=1 Tax=Synchytrium microbalum TaxID=1806994 RepID=A0A507CIE6_9FUNG|nr:uncharacterized protein SmJEL517_g00562 [Synchytrium microbalum]TPX37475.1 hypothetical protein SmJEL517_g00562 [Synchytrium microbalum]
MVSSVLDHLLEDILAQKEKKHRELVAISVDSCLGDALKLLRRHNILALPVYGQKGHWLGVGGDTDAIDGDKHYIGLLSILDITIYLTNLAMEVDAAKPNSPVDAPRPHAHGMDTLDSVSVRTLLGKSPESQTLWIAKPGDKLSACIEPLSKGVHRLLVPQPIGESAGFHLITQSDIIRYILSILNEDPNLRAKASTSLAVLGLAPDGADKRVLTVDKDVSLLAALKGMSDWGINAIPVVNEAKNGVLTGTLSISDLRQVPARTDIFELLSEMKKLTVAQFLDRVKIGGEYSGGDIHHVHRIWIVNDARVPIGIVTLTDIIHAILELGK